MPPPVVHARRARSPSPRPATGGVKNPAQIAGEAAEAHAQTAEAQITRMTQQVEDLQIQAESRLTSRVDWWDNKKKCGVIIQLNGGEIFCHITNLRDGNALEPGSEVQFEIEFNAQYDRDEAVRVRGAIKK